MKTCPRCHKKYSGHPAISRITGNNICPGCGVREALEVYGMPNEIIEQIVAATCAPAM